MEKQTLISLLGEFPRRVPLDARTLESVDCGSFIREKIEYNTEPNESVRAYACIPKRVEQKLPAVFCHHQHDWNFALGKSEVVGLAGDPEQAYAAELASRGFITFAPDAIGFEERNWSGGDFRTCYFALTSRLVAGRTLLAKVLHDASVGIDYLESRADVDRDNIGFLGHSYGGRMAIWLPVFDRRIKASASNCGCIGFKDSLRREAGIQMEFCVPGILKWGEIADVVALAAPTPLLISACDEDIWSSDARLILETLKATHRADHVTLKHWPGGHSFTKPMREVAYRFLEEHLKGLDARLETANEERR